MSNRDGVFGAGLDYWHTRPSHLLNLKLALMLFARYTIAQACWCTRVMRHARLLQMQWGARACKTMEERTVMFCANTNTTRGNSWPELCTGSWRCPALDLHLELGSSSWSNQSEQSCSYIQTFIQPFYMYDQLCSSELFHYKPLCANALWPATVSSELFNHIISGQFNHECVTLLTTYKSESSPSVIQELPTLAYLPTNMARFQCINSCALCG